MKMNHVQYVQMDVNRLATVIHLFVAYYFKAQTNENLQRVYYRLYLSEGSKVHQESTSTSQCIVYCVQT